MPVRSPSSKAAGVHKPAIELVKAPRGRPAGTRGYDASSATAFGDVVRESRLHAGISQEALAYMSDVERAYMGKLERGHNQPTLYVILKIADALGYEAGELIALVQQRLRNSGG